MLYAPLMARGVSIKFKSYQETIPKLLEVIKFDKELQKHPKIVLKPSLRNTESPITPADFVDAILQFCMQHKVPDTQIFIAEGSDGIGTMEMFELNGYKKLAEKYGVGLIDLNYGEVEEIKDGEFLKFDSIFYPKILLESFTISLPKLAEDSDTEMNGTLANMLGAFPASHYKGLFSPWKNKIRNWPAKYAVHDIIKCKMPEFAIIDASEKGFILAGIPLEIDMQASKLLGKEGRAIAHLRLIQENLKEKPVKKTKEIPPQEMIR